MNSHCNIGGHGRSGGCRTNSRGRCLSCTDRDTGVGRSNGPEVFRGGAENSARGGRAPRCGRTLWLCGWLALCLAVRTVAAPAFDTGSPAGFFTNVANLVLLDETARWQAQNYANYTNDFGTTTGAFGLTNIPVYVNGAFVYSPAIQRLLQVTANLYDATSTNFYPSVFRPTFYRDPVSGNVWINGYVNIATVSGPGDPALAAPVDISMFAYQNLSGTICSNVYGIPWIIGAKKGFPSFNEFYDLNSVQVSRLVQVNRASTNNYSSANYTTNEMFVMSITNSVGMSFWNSYSSNYTGSGNITVFMQDSMSLVLTNPFLPAPANPYIYYFTYTKNLASWPGSSWNFNSAPPSVGSVNPSSFITNNWNYCFLPPSAYQSMTGDFIPLNNGIYYWETNVTSNYPFPQFGLMTTNWVQAYIVDGSNVIDYVQFFGPNSARNLTAELADPNYVGPPQFYYNWSTNVYGYNPVTTATAPTSGEVNQIGISRGLSGYTPPPGGTWATSASFGGNNGTIAAQQAYFNAFFIPFFLYNGKTYANTADSVIAPYTPTRTMYDYTLWQANDPLVHYLASDLNYVDPSNTGLQKSDYVPSVLTINTGLNLYQVGLRYQPWGTVGQMHRLSGVDTNAYNLAYKDPLVWGSDFWNFPVAQTWNPNWLGQVHRGTPWQTIYLKATNILAENQNNRPNLNIGTNTWMIWAGDTNATDAAWTSPVNDWHLAGLLATLLNTNASPAFFSVNNPNPAAWAAQLDGLTAWTNSLPATAILLSSNSPAVAALASAIQVTRAGEPGGLFADVGDLFATPALTVQSPFLDWSDPVPQKFATTDADYEQLPAELLAFLGSDSLGTVTASGGQVTVQFTGGAGHVYVLQSSPDLVHWTTLATNSPVNGGMSFVLPVARGGGFYRTLLVQ